mmetsp:Transcript_18141/g.26674  ORF Transcript_18141/g.26674 Transcript_18141/m.26674 type:complete len:88 (+) Transcript_18141:1892-2155(+)
MNIMNPGDSLMTEGLKPRDITTKVSNTRLWDTVFTKCLNAALTWVEQTTSFILILATPRATMMRTTHELICSYPTATLMYSDGTSWT